VLCSFCHCYLESRHSLGVLCSFCHCYFAEHTVQDRSALQFLPLLFGKHTVYECSAVFAIAIWKISTTQRADSGTHQGFCVRCRFCHRYFWNLLLHRYIHTVYDSSRVLVCTAVLPSERHRIYDPSKGFFVYCSLPLPFWI
jgi:hypothetical protein